MQFGVSLHQKLGWRPSNDISQRMWQLVELMQTLNTSQSRRVTLTEALNGQMFNEIDTTTLSVCESYNDPSGRPMLRNPTLGLKPGHNVVKCAEMNKRTSLCTARLVTELREMKLTDFFHCIKQNTRGYWCRGQWINKIAGLVMGL